MPMTYTDILLTNNVHYGILTRESLAVSGKSYYRGVVLMKKMGVLTLLMALMLSGCQAISNSSDSSAESITTTTIAETSPVTTEATTTVGDTGAVDELAEGAPIANQETATTTAATTSAKPESTTTTVSVATTPKTTSAATTPANAAPHSLVSETVVPGAAFTTAAGPGKFDYSKVTFTSDKTEYKYTDTVYIKLNNASLDWMTCDPNVALFRLEGKDWVSVKIVDPDYSGAEGAPLISAAEKSDIDYVVDLYKWYGKLEPGTYRFINNVGWEMGTMADRKTLEVRIQITE